MNTRCRRIVAMILALLSPGGINAKIISRLDEGRA
jgi:hypothetical protein